MKIIQGAKSIDRVIRQIKSSKKKSSTKPTSESTDEEISNLIQLQREAAQSAIEQSTIKPVGAFKGIRAAEKVQEEYQTAKTGVRSRIGKFAKVLGAGEKEASTLDMLFGKKVSEEELNKLREKFKIKTPEQIKKEKEEALKVKVRKAEENTERSKKRDEAVFKIEKLSEQIFNLATSVQKTIQGIANKVGAEDPKEVKITKGRYFDKSGKQLKKSEVEKGSGVTYSKKAGRFKDVKTGKFVSEKVARQRMNIASKAVRAAVPGVAAGAVIAAGTAAIGTGLASKVLQKEEAAPIDDTGKKIDKLSKKVDGVNKGISSILDMFSLKKFYGLIGGAIGAALPLLKKAIEWVWNFAQTGWQWVKDVASTIGDWLKETLLKIKFTIPGVEAFGKTLWDPITIQPFSFLKSDKTVEGSKPIEETAPVPGSMPSAAPAAAPSAAPAPVPAAAAPPAPAPAATAPSAPAPAAAPAGVSRAGGNMPGGGPPRRLGPAAEGRGKIDPSAAKNAALSAANKFGITGPHLAQFMAQLDHESGGFKHVEENLRYSAKRLMEVFPKYYKDPAIAQAEEYQPILIANRVYGGRMGNGPLESGDGYKYRGRGLIQLTGKDNYSRFGRMAGIDLVSNPDMAGDLATAADIAAAFYKKNVMDKGVDGNDTTKVTKIINGGSHGLSHREQLFASYSKDPSSLKATGPAPEAGPMLASSQPPPPAATTDVRVGGGSSGSGGGEQQMVAAATPASNEVAQVAASIPAPQLTAQPAASMVASASAAPRPAATTPTVPTATPVTPTPVGGYAVAAESSAVAAAKEQRVATVSSPSFIPVPVGSSPKPIANPSSGNSIKASSRVAEDSFVRALAKDFAHPSAFTTIGTV